MQPIRDNQPYMALFFVGFMIVGTLFIINLFVGVVIDTFATTRQELGENMLLTDAQR